MECTKCGCEIEIDEIYVITKMLEKGKDLPKVCTECFDDWLDDKELDANVSGGEAV